MAAAISTNNKKAIIAAIVTMGAIVIILDILIWRPALSLVYKYRLENTMTGIKEDSLVNFIFKHSFLLRFLGKMKIKKNRYQKKNRVRIFRTTAINVSNQKIVTTNYQNILKYPLLLIAIAFITVASMQLFTLLSNVNIEMWRTIIRGTLLTFLRVIAAVVLSTLWTLPAGIWISQSASRMKVAQPLSQLLASFPAPMLYPLVLIITFKLGIKFEFSSMLLIFLGVQWYVLFNTLAGGLRISKEIESSLQLMNVSKNKIWRFLYIPSVFPALVTGWVTAAGGAWNASIVAEYLTYKGTTIQTPGIGSLISQSAAAADFTTLAACLTVMVVTVILLNRFLWRPLYNLSQNRFRLDF